MVTQVFDLAYHLGTRFTMRMALLVCGLCIGAACNGDEQLVVSIYGEGTGDGEIRITNDEDQAVIGAMDVTSTMEGGLAAGSNVEIRATAHPGSHFVGFEGDCAGTTSPFSFQLHRPMKCAVRFDKD
jgi:hypothetical protein